MLVNEVKNALLDALRSVEPDADAFPGADAVPVETPRSREHGHYASSLAFQLAKKLKKNPIKLAEDIAGKLSCDAVESVDVVKPGFINIKIKPEALRKVVSDAIAGDEQYGRTDAGKGKKAQVEFVSANPTGPLSVGHGRIAAFGDCLASLLEASGWAVDREFYINNVGAQIRNLGHSLDLRYREALGETVSIDENGYRGDYLVDYAKALVGEHGDALLKLDKKDRIEKMTSVAMEKILAEQKADLEKFGVRYDRWFRENELHESSLVEKTFYFLCQSGMSYEKDDAHWFRSSDFFDKQDRVLKKKGGAPTYFLSDIAYHKNKFDRGYNLLIDIWGADHHGYIDRVKSSMKALGYDETALEILIVQLVRFKQSGELVRMSKRAGNLITLSDLIEEVGKDVARFFFLMRSRESHLDFDLELAKDKSEANPLYYLQYAHARICGILRKAREEGISAGAAGAGLSALDGPSEIALMKFIADFPWEIQTCARAYEPHRLVQFLTDFAGEFHNFYHNVRVIGDDREATPARLALCGAVRIVLRNALLLMGLSAPEEMR